MDSSLPMVHNTFKNWMIAVESFLRKQRFTQKIQIHRNFKRFIEILKLTHGFPGK